MMNQVIVDSALLIILMKFGILFTLNMIMVSVPKFLQVLNYFLMMLNLQKKKNYLIVNTFLIIILQQHLKSQLMLYQKVKIIVKYVWIHIILTLINTVYQKIFKIVKFMMIKQHGITEIILYVQNVKQVICLAQINVFGKDLLLKNHIIICLNVLHIK